MALIKHQKDPALEQTAAGYPEVKAMGTSFKFTEKEVEVLRKLASQVAEIAARPQMQAKAKLWTAHNDLKTDEPVVFIDPENGWNECILASTLECEDPMARVWEMSLRKQIFWAEKMKDDKVIEPYLDVPYSYSDTGWGLETRKKGGENGGSYIVVPSIEDYEDDFPKLHHPEYIIDWEESSKLMELAHSVFDGILTVRRKNTWWWTLGLCWDYVNLRGMENFLCDFITDPEWVEKTLDLLCDGKLKMLDFLEKNGLLAQNTNGTYVGSGGFGYTNDIRTLGADEQVTTRDMWGFCESQETSSVDPDMYGELIFPRHKKILERFALTCYGCCEAYDPRWKYVKNLPNLRRVSVSPWANWATVPEMLGKNYIASVKLSPTPLSVHHMNEEGVRADCRKAVEESKGGICEFIMKDNHTLGNNPQNAKNIPDGYCSDDPEIMKQYQLNKMKRHVENFKDDCYQAFLMPWFGTGVLASGFGTDVIYNEKMDPAVDMSKIREPEEIHKLKMPDPYKDGQMPLVLKAVDHFRETTDLPIGITDCQGPLTTALSIIGYENYIYWMHDYPEVIHELMDKVTDALINWIKVQKKHAGKEVESPEYILGVKFPKGHGNVWIADDDCVIFNDEQYREFVVSYNSRVLKAFGGGGIHYCGTGTQHIESFLVTEGLTCIHNMCLDHLDQAKKMKEGLAKKNIPYILGDFVVTDERMEGYYKELFETIDQTGLIVVPYPAPATALSHGEYMPAERDQLELGKKAREYIMKYR